MLRILPAAALLCSLFPSCAWAQSAPSPSPSSKWDAALEPGARHVRINEYAADGRRLVSERGWLPGLEAAVGYTHGGWRIALAGASYRNDIAYRGQLQNGAVFSTDTTTAQHRAGVQVAYALNDRVRLHGGMERDLWQRAIEGRGAALGMRERSSSTRLLAGAGARLWRSPRAEIGIDAVIVHARPERLRLRFDRELYDEAHLETRSATGLRTALTLTSAALPRWSLALEADWLRIGRSADAPLYRDGVQVGTVAQPEHDRRAIGIRAGYHF